MFTMEQLTEFLGWSTVINFGLLMVTSIMLMLVRKPVARIHAKMFGLTEADCALEYFRYLASYKIAVIVLSLVPYISLKLMA